MASSQDENSRTGSRRFRSEVWLHYGRIEGTEMAKCNYCDKIFKAHSSNNGTSTLRKHLLKCQKIAKNVDSKQKTLVFGCSAANKSPIVSTFSIMGAREFLAKMIILDELPIKLVEGIGFRTFCFYLNPKFRVPSRRTLSRDIKKIFNMEASKLREHFFTTSQRVCLTTDTWTSIQNLNYMVLTAHYIDEEWVVQKKILNFCLVPNHKGESIGKEVEKCLLKWEINNVTTITVDNSSSNDVAISYLKKAVKNWKGLILNGECMHVRCFAHVLNLIVSDGLKEHSHSIARVRKAVKYVRSSPARLQQFRVCVDAVKITCTSALCLDVPTRWNSTYLMLASAVKYETAFEKLAENDSHFLPEMGVEGPPTVEDWSCIREYIKFLETFYTMTLHVSASLHITANMYLGEVCNLKITLDTYANGENETLIRMAKGMQTKFEKYWGSFEKINMLIYVVIIFDPSCKSQFLKHCLTILFGEDKAAEYSRQVHEVIDKLYLEYKNDTVNEDTQTSSDVSLHNVPRPPKPHSALGAARSTIVYSMFYGSSSSSTVNHEMSEIERYNNEKLENFSDNADILSWWKRNSDEYPVLSAIARDILVIPISTVASESAFSCGGRVLDAFRSSLSPNTVEALICSQSWLKSFNPFKINTQANDDTSSTVTSISIDEEEDCTIDDRFEDNDDETMF